MKVDLYLEGEMREKIWSETFSLNGLQTVTQAMGVAFKRCVEKCLLRDYPNGFGVRKGKIDSTRDGVLRQRVYCSGTNIRYEIKDEELKLVEDSSTSDKVYMVILYYEAHEILFLNIRRPRIKHIMVRNYRAIRHFSASLSGDLIVVGLNGAGKTSLLEAILLALAQDKAIRGPIVGQRYEIELELQDETGQLYRVTKKPNTHQIEAGRGLVVASSEAEIKKAFAKMSVEYSPSTRRPEGMFSVGVGVSGMRRTQLRGGGYNVVPRICNVIIDAYIAREMNDSAASGSLNGLAYLERLNQAWRAFYPDAGATFKVVRLPVDGEERLRFNLVYTNSDAPEGVNIRDLSSGELEIFSMLGYLILEAEKADIVIIDEPELHLNRVWHRLLLDQLKFVAPGVQFVFATHSNDIAASVYSGQVAFLKDGVNKGSNNV